MYNGTASPPTPTIDQLALSGVRLEGYYVQKLCSPTRTALLSGRYSYTLGQETDVIVNGQNCDLALNLLTIADHLQRAGWNTSAYGKVRHPVLSVVLALYDDVAACFCFVLPCEASGTSVVEHSRITPPQPHFGALLNREHHVKLVSW